MSAKFSKFFLLRICQIHGILSFALVEGQDRQRVLRFLSPSHIIYMNNKIILFENPEFGQVRSMMMPDGQVGFVGKDVASILGYINTRDALSKHVDAEDKTTVAICVPGSNYKSQAVLINESGVYSLVFGSNLPKAKEFRRWVTSEVLPQIRKTGGYIPLSTSTSTGSAQASTRVEMDDTEIFNRALMIAQKTIELKKLN